MSRKDNPNKVIDFPQIPNMDVNWVWYYKAVISSNKAWKAYYNSFGRKGKK
jgi:hypothetical protein